MIARPFFVYTKTGDIMEHLPKSAKAVMGVYATAATITQGTVAYFGFDREDFLVIMVALFIATVVGTFVYTKLYFKHYGYSCEDGVIIIKKGALFKKRHLVYIDKISSITISENVLHRVFKLCTVYFHMQGTIIRLPFVSVEKSRSLQEILDSRN